MILGFGLWAFGFGLKAKSLEPKVQIQPINAPVRRARR